MASTSAMDLMVSLLERKQAVVDVLDNRILLPLAKKRIKPLDKVLFFEQLESSSLLGFDPARAMEIAHITASEKTAGFLPWIRPDNPLKRIAGDLFKKLQQGQALGEAASHYPNLFDKIAMGLVEAGEHSGSLSDTFASIRQLATRDEKVRDKLISISIYPVLVLGIAAVIVYQLATGPLPQLGKVLEYFKGELPWQSKLIIETGQFIGGNPLLYVIGIATLIFFLTRLPALIRRTPALHQWILKIPFIGDLTLVSIRANFIQTLAMLKKAKVDSLKCLLLLQGISWCYPYRGAITLAYHRVANGEPLAVALAEEVEILGQRTIEYLRVLEETGADVAMLERLALVMNRDLDSAVGRAEAVAKPLIILFLAALIGVIASAVYGPLIELYNQL
ncbi:MAG: type II secretion system F family protein [Verrucomicrobia bacterium]|nr:type II secretion system F family protein [Verrucomicrobiota bacterium]